MKKLTVVFVLAAVLSSCIPDSIKEKVNTQMTNAQQMLADQEFKKAIAHVELHKLRNGTYPTSLRQLEFLNAMDSTMFVYVEYARLDSGYELNMKMRMINFSDTTSKEVALKYPPEFWKGLGCVKSNVKEDW